MDCFLGFDRIGSWRYI